MNLSFQGYGTLNTWTQPANLAQTIKQDLIQAGWGVTDVRINNTPSLAGAVLAAGLSWNYSITIDINATSKDDAPRISQTLNNYLSNYFTGLNFALVDNMFTQAIDTVKDLNTSLGGANTTGTIAGISLTTMAFLAVAGIIIIPKLINSNPVQYKFR